MRRIRRCIPRGHTVFGTCCGGDQLRVRLLQLRSPLRIVSRRMWCPSELLFQLGNLRAEGGNRLHILRYMPVDVQQVARHLGLNVLGLVGILECVVCLVVMRTRRTHTCDHNSLAIATEGKLEQAGQLAVPVRDVSAPCASALVHVRLTQCIDAAAQRKERSVDIGAFLHPHAVIRCRRRTLRACEINDIQRCTAHFLDGVGRAGASSHIHLQYRMTPATHSVRLGRTLCSPLVPFSNHVEDLLGRLGNMLGNADDRDLPSCILSQGQAATGWRGCLRQKVTDRLVVNLQIRKSQIRFILVTFCCNSFIEALHRQENQTRVVRRAANRMGFPASGCSICKNTRIKTT